MHRGLQMKATAWTMLKYHNSRAGRSWASSQTFLGRYEEGLPRGKFAIGCDLEFSTKTGSYDHICKGQGFMEHWALDIGHCIAY